MLRVSTKRRVSERVAKVRCKRVNTLATLASTSAEKDDRSPRGEEGRALMSGVGNDEDNDSEEEEDGAELGGAMRRLRGRKAST